jgi:hypothetical protein
MHRSRSEWGSLLRAYEQRGPQTQIDFCRARGVSLSTLQWHLRKQSQAPAESGLVLREPAILTAPRLVRIELPSSPPSVEVVVGGSVVRVFVGTDVTYVSALVAALQRC